MFGTALSFITKELNSYIVRRQRLPASSERVILTNLVEMNGSVSIRGNNLLTSTLVNIEQEKVANYPNGQVFPRSPGGIKSSPPLTLNLFILFGAYFEAKNLKDGLDQLTWIVQYLQAKSIWDRSNTPGLPEGMDRLVFDFESLDFHAKSHMWGVIGAKQIPSVLYKTRMILVTDPSILEITSRIEEIDINGGVLR